MTISKAIVVKLKFPIGEMHYNVQIIRSVDGHNFFYCGCGTYCKTKQDALLFIRKSKESFEEVIDRDA